MPAATNKSELRAVIDKEYAKIRATLSRVDADRAALCANDDDTSIKAIIAHRTHWMKQFFIWYNEGVAGRPVHVPAKGYKWNQLKQYNATLYAQGDRADWQDLLADFYATAQRITQFIDEHDNEEFYIKGKYAWTNKWSLGRWLEASSASHFRSANTYIRKALRHAGL